MRRISLALALLGAVTACSGGANSSSAGSNKGGTQGTFKVTIQNTGKLAITGGKVVSNPAGIDCGEGATGACEATFAAGTTVSLEAQPTAGNVLLAWAGDCSGWDACTLEGNADKYIVAQFGPASARTGHPNWSSGALHGAQYWAFVNGDAGALTCTDCHGANLEGQGSIAVNCGACHTNPKAVTGGHFDPAKQAWSDHSTGWDQACLRCHTSQGFQDYVGVDGSDNHLDGTYLTTSTLKSTTVACTTATPSTCDPAAYTYGPLKCATCHNSVSDPATGALTTVRFPSGKQITTNHVTGLCGQCHQGRESTTSVDAKIAATAADTAIVPAQGFINPHYLGATATMFGADAAGWAQYPGKFYTGTNKHGVNAAACTSCHDPHDGELPADANIPTKCGSCHFNDAGAPVANFLELEETRQYGFEGDIDGDGVVESLKTELDGVAATLYTAIQQYAVDVTTKTICYSDAYPYFYTDSNGNGTCGDAGDPAALPAPIPADTSFPKVMTPRLLRATFNYKWFKADPGAWAHNPRYAIEILFDAINDLNAGLVAAGKTPVAFNGYRTFGGHFGAATETAKAGGDQFRDWDAAGAVPNNCSQCHAGEKGIANYLADQNTTLTNTPVTGMQCTTCHDPLPGVAKFTNMRAVATLNFPPRKAATKQVSLAATVLPYAKDRVCATCHTGRENMTSIADKNAGKLVTDWTISFTNPHYLGAAGILFGSDTHMMYEYAGQTYAGKPVFYGTTGAIPGPHGSPHGASCTGCHNPQGSRHSFEIDTATTIPAGQTKTCDGCHAGPYALAPKKANITALSDALYTTITAYAKAAKDAGVVGAKEVCYSDAYPYWFDAAATTSCTANLTSANGAKLNPNAAAAAFNYKWSKAEPGAYAHNYEYMAQALYDSIVDLGGTPPLAERP